MEGNVYVPQALFAWHWSTGPGASLCCCPSQLSPPKIHADSPTFQMSFFIKKTRKKALECSDFCGSFENAPSEADKTTKRKKIQSCKVRGRVQHTMVCMHLCDNILFSSVAHVSHTYAVPFPQQLKEERTRVLFFL